MFTSVPITVRTTTGAGFGLGGQHSDMLEAWFAHLPGVVSERDAIFPALIASLLCLFVVSLLTPRPTEAQLKPFAEA